MAPPPEAPPPVDLADQQLAGLIERGTAAFAAGDYTTATEAFTAALELDPANTDAQSFLDRVTGVIEQETALAAQEVRITQEVARLVSEAEQLTTDRDYDAAIARYEDALRLSPSDRRAAAGLSQAQADRARAGNAMDRILGRREPVPADESRQSRIEELLREGEAALENSDFAAALVAYDAVLAIDATNQEATAGRERVVLTQQILGGQPPPP